MLYRPGTILANNPAVVTPSGNTDLLTMMIADTAAILSDDGWEETLTIKRASNTYDAVGLASIIWETVGTFLGDWQPVTGEVVQAEKGLEVKSVARVLCSVTCQADENDKIVRANGSELYVNYVRKYEDHYTVYLKKTKGAE